MARVERRTVIVDGMTTSFLEAGTGSPLVLLHGGEFGASAEFGWERNIAALAEHYRVIAPDQIGYGETAKVIDFNDGRRMRIRHVAQLLALLGIDQADFVGNSMGGVNLIVDQTSDLPLAAGQRGWSSSAAAAEILKQPPFSNALFEYDGTFGAMRNIVEALFHDPSYPADDAYVQRRYDSSIAPGAWEAIAAARLRRPDTGQASARTPPSPPRQAGARITAESARGHCSSRAAKTNSSRKDGRRRSPPKSAMAGRSSSTRPRHTVHRSSSQIASTSCSSSSFQEESQVEHRDLRRQTSCRNRLRLWYR